MKFSVILALLLMIPCLALAAGEICEVVNVNEYVTLRELPQRKAKEVDRIPLGDLAVRLNGSEGEFTCLSYHGQVGYVLTQYLSVRPEERGEPIQMEDGTKIQMNLFLTEFSDEWFSWHAAFLLESCRDREMVDLAVDTLFGREMELGEYGEYNARVSGRTVQDMVRSWFGRESVNLSDTRYKYRDGYYYSEETGGRSTGGFVLTEEMQQLPDGRIRVLFSTYGAGASWKPEAVCTLSESSARAMYPYSSVWHGTALVDMHGTQDRNQWTLSYWYLDSEEISP